MKSDLKKFKVGAKVQWKWMGGLIHGSVKKIFTKSIAKTIKGKIIKRNGSIENPAYLVQSEAGNFALKLHSELLSITPAVLNKPRPTMFSDS